MTLKFVIILQNLIKTYHRKSGKSKCDRKVTELNVEITWIWSRVNGVIDDKLNAAGFNKKVTLHLLITLELFKTMKEPLSHTLLTTNPHVNFTRLHSIVKLIGI